MSEVQLRVALKTIALDVESSRTKETKILFLALVATVSCSLVPYFDSYPLFNDYGFRYGISHTGYGYRDFEYGPYGLSNGYEVYGYPGLGNLNYGYDVLGFR
ncbi:hypothetical protein TNCV_4579851 [Trichonephila clavipes]|nr:hypothetical protein TNCV_4579851 [Trichonephila clavipes]